MIRFLDHVASLSFPIGLTGVGAVFLINGTRGLMGKAMSTLSSGLPTRTGPLGMLPEIKQGSDARWHAIGHVAMGALFVGVGVYRLFRPL